MDQRFHLAKISLASSPCLSMLTLLKHAYSTRLKSSKHAKMSAIMRQKIPAQWVVFTKLPKVKGRELNCKKANTNSFINFLWKCSLLQIKNVRTL